MSGSSGTVEELLARVRELDAGRAGETFELWVPTHLSLDAVPVSEPVALSMVLEALVAKGFEPAGHEQQAGGRLYRYRRSG